MTPEPSAALLAYRNAVDAVGAAAASFTAQLGVYTAHRLIVQHVLTDPTSGAVLEGVLEDYRRLLVLTAERLVIEVVAACGHHGVHLERERLAAIFALARQPQPGEAGQ